MTSKWHKATRRKYSDGIPNSPSKISKLHTITSRKSHKLMKYWVTQSSVHSMISMDGKNWEKVFLLKANSRVDIDLLTTLMRSSKSSLNLTTLSQKLLIRKSRKKDHCSVMPLEHWITKKTTSPKTWSLWLNVLWMNCTQELLRK